MPIMNAGASYASTHTEAALHCSQGKRYVHTYSVFPRARKDPNGRIGVAKELSCAFMSLAHAV